jgi:hypothetical protein
MIGSSRIRSNGVTSLGGVAVRPVQSMAVVAVMLLSTALPGEAQAGKVGQGIDQGRPSGPVGPVDHVEGAFDGDRISRHDGSGHSGISDRFVFKASATIGGEKDPERRAPSEMAGSSAFSATEINALVLLSAFSIFAGALGLAELFRRHAA